MLRRLALALVLIAAPAGAAEPEASRGAEPEASSGAEPEAWTGPQPEAWTGAAAEAWRAAAWGMDLAALDAAAPGLRVLSPPWEYGGGLRAARTLPRAEMVGLPFRALFQTDAEGRLVQILFERNRRELRPGDAVRTLAALRERLGPEDRLCAGGGGPGQAEAVWVLPEGVLHLGWVDFGTGENVSDLDEAERLSLLREGEDAAAEDLRRRMPFPSAAQSGRPRKLTIRWRDAARVELESRVCPP